MTAATPQAEEGIKIQEPDADLKLIEQKRVAPHTHIKGLGLNESGVPIPVAAGFVGQVDAREVLACYSHHFLTLHRQRASLWNW